MKILAVDDDPIILDLLTQFLSVVGHHVLVTAPSAAAALETISENGAEPFDCFLLDIQMPGMDGTALAQRIRQSRVHAFTPIVMLTALLEKRSIDRAFAAGATDYITKPLEPVELATRIGVIEHLVLSRQTHVSSHTLKLADAATVPDLSAPVPLEGISNAIDYAAMENYVAQLSRSSLFGSWVFAFTLRKPESYSDSLSVPDFKLLIQDVAQVISKGLADHHFLMSYAGSGTYLCITRSGYHPDMIRLEDQINRQLNRARIMSHDGAELHPRISSGAAIRLVWKSGEQIPAALATAVSTARTAATEYERLKTNFFQIGISA